MQSNCDRKKAETNTPGDSTITLRDGHDSSGPETAAGPKYEQSSSSISDEDYFDLEHFLKLGILEKRSGGRSQKRLGVIWKDVAVEGTGSTFSFIKTFPDAIIGTFGPDLYRILSRWIPVLSTTKSPTTIISGFTGSVRDGEMMLVLGRPGSGCTTFLKTIANDRKTYSGVKGSIHYGHIPADQQASRYRGEVVYCSEDDVHFSALSVWRTVVFALWNKTKKKDEHAIPHIAKALLRMFGLSHAKNTFVGDAFLRGVSGGERKRVSIIETLTSKANVVCWDNSTRGLDSTTALDFARSLRTMTDISNRTTLVALYQTGESIYNLFDKVMLLDSGKCVYQGPVSQAKQYFVDLGFYCSDRMTTADFLTSVTDPIARRVRAGCELTTPRTATELEEAYLASTAYQKVLKDVRDYEAHPSQPSNVSDFQQAVTESKSKYARDQSLYTVSFYRQVVNCTKREFWLLFNDWEAIYTKTWVILLNAFVVGSLFYGASNDTSGAFGRGGGIFFSILFLGWVQLPELMKAVSGRTIVQRHKDYAFYRPSALAIARAIADAPVLLAETSLFSIVMYFMASFDVDAGKFWVYFLFVFTNTFCTTALYRLFASVSPTMDDAVRFSGVGFNIMIIFNGYVIPKRHLFKNSPWFGWLHYPNPIAMAFEGVFSNEFTGRRMICAESNRVPRGPGIDPNYQGCLLQGSGVNNLVVTGEDYLDTAYDYHRTDLWRNFGIMLAFLIVYTLLSAIIAEIFAFPEQNAGGMQYTKTKRTKALAKRVPDEEEKGHRQALYQQESHQEHVAKLPDSDNVFTWQDVDYTVPVEGGEKKLLDKVSGYVKPGVMIALMGASGAGKTTLLNVLSQRQRVGVVTGDMLANGHPLTASFKRSTGFCEQMDIHDGTATIREALEFSAILRQDRHIPRSEKLAYVDKVLELLELESVQDAVISSLGVDVRKRTTIGVELVAKPTLLFLDEPTSGIDSQSAFSIVHFLKKLTRAGQAIICTIHQPSSVLFEQFDMVLALNPGGKTFYFGDIGPDGTTIVNYFSSRGAPCPPTMNIAEFILETAIRGTKRPDGSSIDWTAEWLSSPERLAISSEITRLTHLAASQPLPSLPTEFAAPVSTQVYLLTRRVLIQHWRDPSYVYGKIFVSTIIGLFTGFTFYSLGHSITDLTSRIFTCFILAIIPSCTVNAILPKFYSNMDLWLAREYPSRIYGWVAFSTAQIVAELPYAVMQAVVWFLLWYYPTGAPRDSGTAGYVFLMTVVFHVYQASWGQWICAWAPSYTVISNILPTFFVIFALFPGIVRPWSTMPSPWRYFLYYATPSTYWAGGILSAILDGQPVLCTLDESARFLLPPGQNCESYAGGFVAQTGGYLLSNTTLGMGVGQCAYCPYTTGNDYLATLNLDKGVKWPYAGIFMAFCVSNWFLVYFFVWSVRVKGWSFGIGRLLRLFKVR